MSSASLVAFVTYDGIPDLTADDRLAVVALADLGVRTDAVCWDDARVDWHRYDAIVLRSTWDYFLRAASERVLHPRSADRPACPARRARLG